MRSSLILVVILMGCFPALAEDDARVRKDLAVELVEATRGSATEELMEAIWPPYERELRVENPRVTDETLASVRAVLTDSLAKLAGDMKSKAAELYARDLSADDLRAALDFFDTEAGMRFLDEGGVINREASGLITDYMTTTMAQVITELNNAARRAGLKVAA